MKRAIIAGLCLVFACSTEPQVELSFDGSITNVFKVIGIFGGSTDYTVTVDQDPSHTDLNDPCADKANVHLAASTTVAWSDAPEVQVSAEELMPLRKVRVKPAVPTGSGCSRRIEATSIVIVK